MYIRAVYGPWGTYVVLDPPVQIPSKLAPAKAGCQNPTKCGGSTNIAEDPSFGWGKLDDYGFWEIGCSACARRYEQQNPGQKAWPYKEAKV